MILWRGRGGGGGGADFDLERKEELRIHLGETLAHELQRDSQLERSSL